MPNFLMGFVAKAYYHASTLLDDSSNTIDVLIDTMVEAGNIRDLTSDIAKDEVDISTRADADWKTTVGGQKDLTIDFQIKWVPGDAFFEALKDAFLDDTEIAMVFLDQAKTEATASGPAGNFTVFNFTLNQELSSAQMVDVSLKPSSYPQWADVSEFPSA